MLYDALVGTPRQRMMLGTLLLSLLPLVTRGAADAVVVDDELLLRCHERCCYRDEMSQQSRARRAPRAPMRWLYGLPIYLSAHDDEWQQTPCATYDYMFDTMLSTTLLLDVAAHQDGYTRGIDDRCPCYVHNIDDVESTPYDCAIEIDTRARELMSEL